MTRARNRRGAFFASLLAGTIAGVGCPAGDGTDGPSPVVRIQSTPDCRVIAGGFPSGFAGLPGADDQAAVVQFRPFAVIGLDLDPEPPSPLAANPVPALPELPSVRCGGLRPDSDSDGRPDPDRSDELGFGCLSPTAGTLNALANDLVAVTTSAYEQILFVNPQDGSLRMAALDPPAAGAGFDPADWPFWPAAGALPFQSGFSTRACVYGTGLLDSNAGAIGANTRCDPGRDGFFTSFTKDVVAVGARLFVATSNLIRPGQAQYAPGTVLVFDLDLGALPPRVGPDAARAIQLTTGYNPTSLTPYTTPGGRDLVLVGVSGAIAQGNGPGLVRTDSAIDVIDATSLDLIATIPLGRAGLGFDGLAIDATARLGLIGAATSRALFGIDLAALDDPALGNGAQTLPIVLDGMTPGFPDARVYDAARPFALPKRPDGPLDSVCTSQTSVAIRDDNGFAAATDFCDGTLTRIVLDLPASRGTLLDPDAILAVDRLVEIVAPLVRSANAEIRAPVDVRIRSGTPGLDYPGPDVHFTTGLPEGAVCGVRIDAI